MRQLTDALPAVAGREETKGSGATEHTHTSLTADVVGLVILLQVLLLPEGLVAERTAEAILVELLLLFQCRDDCARSDDLPTFRTDSPCEKRAAR